MYIGNLVLLSFGGYIHVYSKYSRKGPCIMLAVVGWSTSSSAIAERLRDACLTSNRKPVKTAFVRQKSVDVSDFSTGWVTSSTHFRWRGMSPTNQCWWQKTRRIAISCGVKISPVGSVTPKTTLA